MVKYLPLSQPMLTKYNFMIAGIKSDYPETVKNPTTGRWWTVSQREGHRTTSLMAIPFCMTLMTSITTVYRRSETVLTLLTASTVIYRTSNYEMTMCSWIPIQRQVGSGYVILRGWRVLWIYADLSGTIIAFKILKFRKQLFYVHRIINILKANIFFQY